MSDMSLRSAGLLNGREVRREGFAVRALLIAIALGFLTLFLALPLAIVFVEAFARGWNAYLAGLSDPDSLAAIRLKRKTK
jgi:sulfate transport system permease protein